MNKEYIKNNIEGILFQSIRTEDILHPIMLLFLSRSFKENKHSEYLVYYPDEQVFWTETEYYLNLMLDQVERGFYIIVNDIPE